MWLSTELSSASVQLAIGESQLDAAYEEFAKQQDEAFKNAGLHGALTPELLATILGAEHFSMPARLYPRWRGANTAQGGR